MAAMCELFAMSSRLPTTVTISLEELARRGGETGPHDDGWGIAYYEGKDLRLIKDMTAASDSVWVRLVGELQPRSTTVIAHIRNATVGDPSFANTHPFTRELGGHRHVFAHNGGLQDLGELPGVDDGTYRAIGETDSERAFCALLHRMEAAWRAAGGLPPLKERTRVVAEFAAEIRQLGAANFLYSDGEALFLHGHRRWDGQKTEPPGLHILSRVCVEGEEHIACAGVTLADADQEVILVASVPLTDEDWMPLAEGDLVVLKDGAIVGHVAP